MIAAVLPKHSFILILKNQANNFFTSQTLLFGRSCATCALETFFEQNLLAQFTNAATYRQNLTPWTRRIEYRQILVQAEFSQSQGLILSQLRFLSEAGYWHIFSPDLVCSNFLLWKYLWWRFETFTTQGRFLWEPFLKNCLYVGFNRQRIQPWPDMFLSRLIFLTETVFFSDLADQIRNLSFRDVQRNPQNPTKNGETILPIHC